MSRSIIHTDKAPAAIGPYSQAVRAGSTVYLSGQIPLAPGATELVDGSFREQVRQVFRNLAAVAEAAGSDFSKLLKLTIYLTDLANFSEVNKIMEEFFQPPYPARAAVGVKELPKGATVEMDAILLVD